MVPLSYCRIAILGVAAVVAAGLTPATRAAPETADEGWVLLGLKAFCAAVVGGIGNVRGAMLGGLLIGMVELFGAAYVSTTLRDAYVFLVLIAVLLFRPTGLLGRATVEKV